MISPKRALTKPCALDLYNTTVQYALLARDWLIGLFHKQEAVPNKTSAILLAVNEFLNESSLRD